MANPPTDGNLFIGHGVIANGKISAPGEVIIDGQMSGEITADKLSVGKTGKLTANAVANYVDVSGEVTQKTVANISLSIQSSGMVSGEVSYGDLGNVFKTHTASSVA